MHLAKFPELSKDIDWAFGLVHERKVLPSMRTLQFAGAAIKSNPARGYNCCALPIDDVQAFREITFLLLSGTGVGYSVQKHHCNKLPVFKKPKGASKEHIVSDTIEGWADAVHELLCSYFFGSQPVVFDFSLIRDKGKRLVTSGGRAPGPKPLKKALESIQRLLDTFGRPGHKLHPWVVSDLICIISEAVRSGGIRRSALIALFSQDDEDMATYKVGQYWHKWPYRAMTNVSMVLNRSLDKKSFSYIWDRVSEFGTGEHGIYWSNDFNSLTNPCVEASVSTQFCNLSTINASNITNQQDYLSRCRAASLIGTLQASYTDFHYLRPRWRTNTERDALIGVSMTGVASGALEGLDVYAGAKEVADVNAEYASLLGINKAARTTLMKPEGTSSLYLSNEHAVSCGIHNYHSKYYLRRVEIQKHDEIYVYLKEKHPGSVEDSQRENNVAYVVLPMRAPQGASTRDERDCFELLKRVKKYYRDWVQPGHRNGLNTHSISCTVSIRPGEWQDCGQWMYSNRSYYAGLAVLPYDGGVYTQTPYEQCSEDEYIRRMGITDWDSIDLTEIIEADDYTMHTEEISCSFGGCDI